LLRAVNGIATLSIVAGIVLFAAPVSASEGETVIVTPELREQALGVLRSALSSESPSARIRAAKHLHALGYLDTYVGPTDHELASAGAHGEDGGGQNEKTEECVVLAGAGEQNDLPVLVPLLEDDDRDVRVAAANAVLRIERRVPHRPGLSDWIVIAAYAAAMLVIGWYYARRTRTTEDYLLGGRQMRPLLIGVSLFATYLSTLSYLMWPGEMIKYGPMFLCMLASYPLVLLVVGWLIIPLVMKQQVTTAYEILEIRLGTGVRLLGSFFFLCIRLIWMSVVIYATVSKVLIPLLGFEDWLTPYLCAAIGLVTVTYASMGGLRAVVLTDVVQTMILVGGVVVAIAVITVDLGGVAAWWPKGWAAHWPEPKFGYDPRARMTFVGLFVSVFTWYVCTSGSDQMAVQRYLSTRDVKAARRALATSLTADTMVTLLLSALGLALLKYFQANPHLIPDRQTILTDSDALFPRFIAFGLPPGISGLVIAAVMAAAMSSLSSGVNSAASVITADILDFRRRRNAAGSSSIRLAQSASVAVGAVVIALSAAVGQIQGNLLEIAYKTVNLLVAPLFGLFFMAMLVPWATQFGTVVGAGCGIGVVVAVNYWQELTGQVGGSFLWGMPLGLLVQLTVGAGVSLLQVGRKSGTLIGRV